MLEKPLDLLLDLLPVQLAAKIRQEGPQRYFFHTGWNLAGKIFSLGIAFFVSIYVVRSLGPSNWGLLSYVVSFTGIFSFIASLGVDSILYVDLIKRPEDRDKLLGTAFMLKFLGGAMAFTLVLVFSLFSTNNFYTNVLLAVVGASFFFQPFNVINLYFQANVQSKPAVVLSLSVNILLSALKVALVMGGASLKYFAFVYLVEAVITAAGYLYIYHRAGLSARSWQVDWQLGRQMFMVSWPLILSSAFAYIYSRIDQVMIKHMLDQESVGLYDTGVRLAEVWYIFPTIIIGSMTPAIINAQKVGRSLFESRISKLYAFTTYLALLFIVPISLLSGFIVQQLYGPEFAGAAGVLKIYVWAGISVAWATVINQYLINENLTVISLFLNSLGMVVNIAINIFAIPRYGIEGAAWATLVSYSVIPLGVIFFKKVRGQLAYIGHGLVGKF